KQLSSREATYVDSPALVLARSPEATSVVAARRTCGRRQHPSSVRVVAHGTTRRLKASERLGGYARRRAVRAPFARHAADVVRRIVDSPCAHDPCNARGGRRGAGFAESRAIRARGHWLGDIARSVGASGGDLAGQARATAPANLGAHRNERRAPRAPGARRARYGDRPRRRAFRQ